MSDVSLGPGWWRASDGKWYPPSETDEPPEPGWWLASDGKWYPPDLDPGPWPETYVPPTPKPTTQPESRPEPARTSGPAQAEPVRRSSARVVEPDPEPVGLDPVAQVEVRNEASRADAAALAAKRAAAAARALASLQAEPTEASTPIAEPAKAAGPAAPPPPPQRRAAADNGAAARRKRSLRKKPAAADAAVARKPAAGPASPADRGATPAPTAVRDGRLDEADLLRKLGDLHRAGVLTASEYADKIALVDQLVRGELTATS